MNVIEVKGLGKKYRIGKAEKKSETLIGSIVNGLKQPLENLRKIRSLTRLNDEEDIVWALRDVSFEVKEGEVLGIIGHNGAGKSTLLKILSRITEPSVGEVHIKGRVAALLEVGTGFHPELTGRENVYMNGTILGMRKKEIDRKLDEIVAFSGVEKFLDTAVKFYSSGMRVRLGFSVAAHLEPEILIIDEVLAVGDAEFQRKCLGKMQDVSTNQGRTVLFVSHNMGAVNQLCQKGAVLKNGNVQFVGNTENAIEYYLNSNSLTTLTFEPNVQVENRFLSIDLINDEGKSTNDFSFTESITISVLLEIEEWNPSLELSLSVYDNLLRRVFTKNIELKHYYSGQKNIDLKVTFDGSFLMPGSYSWIMAVNLPKVRLYDVLDNVLRFSVHETGSDFYDRQSSGCVFPPPSRIRLS